MPRNKSSILLGAALMAVTVTLVLASSVWAQSNYKVIHDFTGPDGTEPGASVLIFDAAGNLYGSTLWGGDYGCGVTFKLTPIPDGSWTETVLHGFTCDQMYPDARLTLDAAGNLYGTTESGGSGNCPFGGESRCGTVYQLTPNPDGSWTHTVLHTFTGGKDGSRPLGLAFGPEGNLYGAANTGGAHGCGDLFTLTPQPDGSWKQKVIHQFQGRPACGPAVLIFNQAGNFYGATLNGGPENMGTAYEMTPNPDGTWTYKVIHVFGGKGGNMPLLGLIDGAGNLYGTTYRGGDLSACGGLGCGTVFKLAPTEGGRWQATILHRFKGKDGANANGDLVFDASGNLYGTTRWGGLTQLQCNEGPGGCGTVFKLTPNPDGSWKEQMLYRFRAEDDGGEPLGGVILDGAGNLYGTANYYGPGGYGGVAFQITP